MQITKYNLGPSVTIAITLEMLSLLGKVAEQSAANKVYTPEQKEALAEFRDLVLATTANPAGPGVTHGFCL